MSTRGERTHGGVAPFGYMWMEGRLVLDPREAPIRKLAFELFLRHKRKKTVAKVLNELGHRTRNGAAFSDTTVGRLLSDSIVLGTPPPDASHLPGDALVDTDLWEKTQALLGRKPVKRTTRLFTQVAYCECGGKMLTISGSSKIACRTCRRKIEESDLEEILHSKLADQAIFGSLELFERWYELPADSRRSLIEHICDRIVVGSDSIRLEIAYSTDSVASEQNTPEEGPPLALDEQLLSESEAAKFLGVSKMTLLRKRQTLDISHFRVGSRILYSKQKHLLPYLEKNEKKAS